MKIKQILLIPVVAGALTLAGCASQNAKLVNLNLNYVNDNSAATSIDHNAQAQLAEAATAVSHSLQQDAAIQQANNPGVRMPAPRNPKALGMAQIASLSWTGPVKALLKSIAHASHYRLRVLGKTATPPLVNINAQNLPLAYILRQAKYQVVGKANISVYPRRRIIELRYR